MDDQATVTIDLSHAEVELIEQALGYLEATLGREEADELTRVIALLEKLKRHSR